MLCLIPHVPLVSQQGSLRSFVHEEATYVGYVEIKVAIQNVACLQQFYVMDANLMVPHVTLGQLWQRHSNAHIDWRNNCVGFTTPNGKSIQQPSLNKKPFASSVSSTGSVHADEPEDE